MPAHRRRGGTLRIHTNNKTEWRIDRPGELLVDRLRTFVQTSITWRGTTFDYLAAKGGPRREKMIPYLTKPVVFDGAVKRRLPPLFMPPRTAR